MQTPISVIPELSQGCKSAGKPAPPSQKRVVGSRNGSEHALGQSDCFCSTAA